MAKRTKLFRSSTHARYFRRDAGKLVKLAMKSAALDAKCASSNPVDAANRNRMGITRGEKLRAREIGWHEGGATK